MIITVSNVILTNLALLLEDDGLQCSRSQSEIAIVTLPGLPPLTRRTSLITSNSATTSPMSGRSLGDSAEQAMPIRKIEFKVSKILPLPLLAWLQLLLTVVVILIVFAVVGVLLCERARERERDGGRGGGRGGGSIHTSHYNFSYFANFYLLVI